MTDIDSALAGLERDARKNKTLSRYDARAALIAIGERLLEGRDGDAQAWLARLSAIRALSSPGFDAVVAEEMSLACSEHIRGCDRRYLDHPQYDFAYTIEARHRLEARLRALERLEIEVDEGLLQRVTTADEALAPYLARIEKRER